MCIKFTSLTPAIKSGFELPHTLPVSLKEKERLIVACTVQNQRCGSAGSDRRKHLNTSLKTLYSGKDPADLSVSCTVAAHTFSSIWICGLLNSVKVITLIQVECTFSWKEWKKVGYWGLEVALIKVKLYLTKCNNCCQCMKIMVRQILVLFLFFCLMTILNCF